jgi:hypothetical protein
MGTCGLSDGRGALDCPASELGRRARKTNITIFSSIGLAWLPRLGKINRAALIPLILSA